MAITRRKALGGAIGLAGAGSTALPRPALAQAQPFKGQEVKVLTVRATQFQAQAKRVAAFTERTGIRVTYTDVPFPSMREKLTAEMVGNSADFDLMTVMDAWVPSLTNMMKPITPRLQAKGISTDRYPRPFVNAGTMDGQVYGLPVRGSVQVLYYRKDLFEKNGLRAPATWDEAAAAGRTLQERESIAGIAMYYGRNNGQNLMPWYNFLWTNGADFLTPRLEPVFNSEAGLAATQRYLDLMLKDRVTPTGSASFDEQAATASFLQGNSAMVPVWNWVMVRFTEPSSAIKLDQVGFAPMPTMRPGVQPTTFTNTWVLAMNGRSARKDATMEYIAWASSPELEREILLDPAEKEVITVQWSNLRDPEVNARWNGMQATGARALEAPNVIPQFPQLPQVVDVVETAMSNAATGSASVADAMNGAARQVTRIASGRRR